MRIFCVAAAMMVLLARAQAAEAIPAAGNAYLTAGSEKDPLQLTEGQSVLSVFFYCDRATALECRLRASAPDGAARLKVSALGSSMEAAASSREAAELAPLALEVSRPGYVRVDIQGVKKSGASFARIESLEVTAAAAGAQLSYVRDNGDNRFYWGRRGPSVHLGYAEPAGEKEGAEWFYNEVTVPVGKDPEGSYFMANGFGEGYFGMQVNGPAERRILFSVWSPAATDHPEAIPEEQKVTLLKKGEGVHGGEFGGEGSGGQSYWPYPWKAGESYRFLNRAEPDGKGATVYTAWFFVPETKAWKLIASFRRPGISKRLTGLHSFVENFNPAQGWRERSARFGPQWACDAAGTWREVTAAHFSGDDIASRGWRRDYDGGVKEGRFYLANGGFTSGATALGTALQRPEDKAGAPQIDLKALEGAGE